MTLGLLAHGQTRFYFRHPIGSPEPTRRDFLSTEPGVSPEHCQMWPSEPEIFTWDTK